MCANCIYMWQLQSFCGCSYKLFFTVYMVVVSFWFEWPIKICAVYYSVRLRHYRALKILTTTSFVCEWQWKFNIFALAWWSTSHPRYIFSVSNKPTSLLHLFWHLFKSGIATCGKYVWSRSHVASVLSIIIQFLSMTLLGVKPTLQAFESHAQGTAPFGCFFMQATKWPE